MLMFGCTSTPLQHRERKEIRSSCYNFTFINNFVSPVKTGIVKASRDLFLIFFLPHFKWLRPKKVKNLQKGPKLRRIIDNSNRPMFLSYWILVCPPKFIWMKMSSVQSEKKPSCPVPQYISDPFFFFFITLLRPLQNHLPPIVFFVQKWPWHLEAAAATFGNIFIKWQKLLQGIIFSYWESRSRDSVGMF